MVWQIPMMMNGPSFHVPLSNGFRSSTPAAAGRLSSSSSSCNDATYEQAQPLSFQQSSDSSSDSGGGSSEIDEASDGSIEGLVIISRPLASKKREVSRG